MSSNFAPEVSADVFDLRPDYCALSIIARGIDNSRSSQTGEILVEAAEWVRARPPEWADAHLESWRAAYRAFGAKPQRTPCSAEALRKRLDTAGELPRVNPAVDLYNAVSVRYAAPAGGENIAAYRGTPRLVRARGDECFDTVKEGAAYSEQVPAGEVVWRDDLGATCRRWNWRQGVRTRIDAATRDMWFLLERLEPMPVSSLLEAGAALSSALARLNPSAHLSSSLIQRISGSP
jgi:DNA/RNA-binding domain of Phe-tRNA-synthetase-like protein